MPNMYVQVTQIIDQVRQKCKTTQNYAGLQVIAYAEDQADVLLKNISHREVAIRQHDGATSTQDIPLTYGDVMIESLEWHRTFDDAPEVSDELVNLLKVWQVSILSEA